MLSKSQKKKDVRSDLLNLWSLFFSALPDAVVESELRHIEDHIALLHDKGGPRVFVRDV